MNLQPGGSTGARPGFPLVLAAVLAILVGLAAHLWLTTYHQVQVMLVGRVLLTAAALFASARRSLRPGPESMGWKVISLFLVIAICIQGVRITGSLGIPMPTETLRALEVLAILGSGLQVGALLVWHLAPRSRFDRIRHGLDGLLFALAIFFILWGLVLGPAFQSDRFPLLDRLLWLATFLIYDLLLGLTVYLGLPEPSRFKGPLGWLAGAFLLASLFNFDTLMESLSGAPIIRFPAGVHFAVPLAYLGAALSRAPVASTSPARQRTRLVHALPYIPVLGATGLGIWLLITGTGSGHRLLLIWLALGLVLVILVRQYLALRDFSTLSQHLETRVVERTEALEKAQSLLLRTERMNTMATLGAGLAHDMNNLLCAIQARTDLVIADLDEGKVPDRLDMVRVQEATQHVASLSGRLMTMGREDAEPPRILDLVEELHAIQPLLQVLLPRNQSLRLDCEAAPVPFPGTRGMLEQILVNLVSNARDAMASGGTITLRARASQPDEGPVGPLLEIEDTGCGIPRTLQDQIFQPFFTTKASGTGTGLGLVSVKSLLEKAGGSIRFVTHPGQGTTFRIRLPRQP